MDFPGYCIAVVDDDEAVRRAVSRLLRANGYRPQAFVSAEQFLQADTQAACLLLDIDLGGMSGLDLYRRLRALPNGAPPAVFMTGNGTPEMERTAREMQCIAFLAKPFDSTVLLEAIRRAVVLHAAR